jgi:GT2 family glycosyltransferase
VNTEDLAVTIIIPSWNGWSHTRACLESLRSTLRAGDQVVVVDNGSTDATTVELASYPWAEVVSNETNRGFAPAANQGAAVARGGVMVFLNNRTTVANDWLDELLSPFANPQVGAVGPILNAEGISTGETLGGSALAVRTELFRTVAGFDEGFLVQAIAVEDLCLKIRSAGSNLYVAHGSIAHQFDGGNMGDGQGEVSHEALDHQWRFREKWGLEKTSSSPLLSVCLIVKDEELMLRSCLESVIDLVDEIVVYDTGSTDRTVEIARSMGARVFEGYWDGSFARARNIALAQARSEWILVIDADEKFLGDPQACRTLLQEQHSDAEAFLVAIESLNETGNASSTHMGVRFFRRSACVYLHRLHEQVVAKDDPDRPLRISYLGGARLIHYGYVAEVFKAKNKVERNLALAKAALDDTDISRVYSLMNYGRALEAAGRSEEAVEILKETVALPSEPITQRMVFKILIDILTRLGRFEEGLLHVEALRRICSNQIAADIAEGRTRIAMGQTESGLSLLARIPVRGRDEDGVEYTVHALAAVRGMAFASLGRFAEAADVVLEGIRGEGIFEVDLRELASWLVSVGRSPMEIVEVLDVKDLAAVLGRLLRMPVDIADELLEGIWARFSDRLEPLAAAGRLGPQLPLVRALIWSARLRERGLARACPLVAMARNPDLGPRERILAGAVAFGSFGERSVINPVYLARAQLDPPTILEMDQQISRLAPGFFEASHLDSIDEDEVASAISPMSFNRGRTISVAAAGKVCSNPRRGGVNIVGQFEGTTAEAHVARILAASLRRQGVKVSTTSYHSSGSTGSEEWIHPDEGGHPFDTTLLVMSPEDLTNFSMDNGVAAFENRYMIGVWLWEFERASQRMSMAAQMVHEIWAPSEFSVKAVAKITDRRVSRMLLPVDSDQSQLLKESAGPEFTFLASVDYDRSFERQNPLGIVAAFDKAFKPDQGPRLVIETAHSQHYPAQHAQLLNAITSRSDIRVIDDPHGISGQILNGHVADRSCFVSLHRSEGSGRVLARAIFLGIPTIVTGHSFSAELQNSRESFLVPFVLASIPENECWGESVGRWAEPDLDEAARAMRRVFEEPKLAIARASKAQLRGRRLFSSPSSVKAIQDRLAVIDRLRNDQVDLSR